MEIRRSWAMPDKSTFRIKPIGELIGRYLDKAKSVVDPFAGDGPFKPLCLTNDINEECNADYHLDALEFLQNITSSDLVLFDPPYSPRQVSECYRHAGKSVNMQTTQSKFWGDIKKEISRIVETGGHVITFGWNSGGVGKKHGFEIVEILLVAHGGWHNDTICTVERKI